MAFVVPALAALGGGSAVTGGVIAATVAISAGAGAYSAIESHKAGVAASQQAQQQATADGDQARVQEINRRRDLVKALSTQDAYAGATGQAGGGSLAAIARSDINDASNDLLTSNLNSTNRQRALRMQASSDVSAGNAKAYSSLLDTVSSSASRGYGMYAAAQ